MNDWSIDEMLDDLKTALEDRYTIERELGAGGMATVYLAHDRRHNRKVAVKVMQRELATIIALARPPISGITSFSKIRSMTSALY